MTEQFPSKRCISNEKTCYFYTFYNEYSTQKFKAFSTFIDTLSRAIALMFAVCGATEKLA
jgi:hypothetical protein